MKGRLTGYSTTSCSGWVKGEDGIDYPFQREVWCSQGDPAAGESVVFKVESGRAISIYRWGRQVGRSGSKNKLAAALLAFLLGGVGAHKFYLGRTGTGFIHLLPIVMYIIPIVLLFTTSVDPFPTFIIVTWAAVLAGVVLGIISVIEAILYFTKTDEEFQRDYVNGQRAWF